MSLIEQSALRQAPKRHRPRKSIRVEPGAWRTESRDVLRGNSDVLDSEILTPQVWKETFEIFQLHFSAELSFLHRPSFLDPLRQRPSTHRMPRPDAPPLVLLAFLSLTARYHDQLVAHHSQPLSNGTSNSSIASEFYAKAALKQLGDYDGGSLDQPNLECLQALLMLGLYEWGIGNSYKAFRLVGDAIRMTQAMGLAAEPKVADEQLVSSSVSYSKTQATDRSPQDRIRAHKGYNARDISVQEEIRIRTFWSCFIMDRYLSSGQPSLQMFDVEKLRIRLPCSEIDFLSKRRVLTESFTAEARGGVRVVSQSYGQRNSRQSSAEPWPLLPQRSKPVPKSFRCQRDQAFGRGLDRKVDHEQYDQENVKCQTGPNESVLSRVMMIIEIWGRVAKWSCEGGRRIESKPPWESGSTFYDLEISLTQFVDTLPEYLLFTIDHLSAHIASGSPTPYVLMHTVYFLCLIVLHREYVPYIPWKCSKPEGPVDEPTFPPAKYKIPKGWWEKSATKLFGAARSILNLVQECRAHDVLVESFLVCFAVFLVAFVGVYCDNFPYMDTMGVMCCKKSTTSSATDGDHRSEPADIALDIISHMRPRLKVAAEWCKTIINERYDYPSKIKRYKEENRGGGLDDWLKQGRYNAPSCLGINREEMDRPASGRSSVSMHDTSVSDAESVTVSGEAMDGVIRRTSCGTSRGTNSIPINPTGKNARAFDVSGPMGSNQGEMPIQLEFPTASQGVQNSLSYPLQDQQQFADSSRFAVQSCRTPPSSFSTTPMPMFGSPNLYSIPSWGFDEYCPEDTPGFWDALGVIAVQDPQQHFMTGY